MRSLLPRPPFCVFSARKTEGERITAAVCGEKRQRRRDTGVHGGPSFFRPRLPRGTVGILSAERPVFFIREHYAIKKRSADNRQFHSDRRVKRKRGVGKDERDVSVVGNNAAAITSAASRKKP